MSEGGIEKGLPILSGQEGYKEWARQMMGYLMMINAWEIVNGTEKAPDPSKAEDLKDWKRQEGRARGVLMYKTTSEVAKCYEGKTSSADIWTVLKTTYEKSDNGYSFSRFERLLNFPRFDKSKPIIDQVQMFIGLIDELTSDKTSTISEHLKVFWLFSKMPESYRPSVSTILHTTETKDLTLDNVKSKLKLEDSLRDTSIGRANKISKPKTRPKSPCSHCGKDNRNSSNCYKKYPEKNPRNKKNKDKGKGNGSENQAGNGNSNGHNHAHTISALSTLIPVSTALNNEIAASFYKASSDAERANKVIWLMDSGASQHVTGCFDDFIEYQKYDEPRIFGTAQEGNAGNVEGLGEGIVKGHIMIDGRRVNITLHKVCYVPAVGETRLFSTGVIERSHSFIYQGAHTMSIFDQEPKGSVDSGSTVKIMGQKVLSAQYVPWANLYFFLLDLEKKNSGILDATSTSTINHDLAHRRWGHPGKEAVRRLPDAVKGVDGVGPPSDKPCDACARGKMTRAPFPPSEKRASEPGVFIHMDVAGPISTSIGGYSYFCVFVDDCSGLGRVYCLKHKSGQEEAFKLFKAWCETQTGRKIKKVRSDRGGEYMSDAFKALLLSYGIEHDTTMPGSPQQNGRAERFIRTIEEKALCMLHFASLSHGFWKLAVEAAVYIYNRQPMKRLKWQCPITVWSGKQPDVSYFRVFGCRAYVHVQKDKRQGKLDVKAVERTFVGYEFGSKGYRLWNPTTRQVEVSRNVIFDETVFPAREDTGTRRANPDDSPFPEYQPSHEDELPLPVPEDNPPPPPAPPADPDPAPDPAPAPQPPEEQPQLPPQAPPPPPQVPQPNHRRARPPQAVGDAPPRCSERSNKGVPPKRYTDNNAEYDGPLPLLMMHLWTQNMW